MEVQEMAHKFHDKRKLRIIYTHVVPMLELEPWDKEGSDVYRLRGETKRERVDWFHFDYCCFILLRASLPV
jgi:hypothetical protein